MRLVDDFLCVPRLTSVALMRLRSVNADLVDVARAIGVRMPAESNNAHNLEEVEDPKVAGFLLRTSSGRLDRYCRQFGVSFRFIGFNVVPASDYETLFEALGQRGAFVGIGLRYGLLLGLEAQANDRHVMEVRAWDEQKVELWDWMYEPPLPVFGTAANVETAVRADSDGFWVFEEVGV